MQPKNTASALTNIRANILGQQDSLRLAGASPAVQDPPHLQTIGADLPVYQDRSKRRSLMFAGDDDVQYQDNDPCYEDEDPTTARDARNSHRTMDHA